MPQGLWGSSWNGISLESPKAVAVLGQWKWRAGAQWEHWKAVPVQFSPHCSDFGCQGSQEPRRAIWRNRIREEKLVLQVFPAGGGEGPSQRLQGYLQKSLPQKQPVLTHGKPWLGGVAKVEASSFTPEPAPPHGGDGERVCARSQLCKASQKQGQSRTRPGVPSSVPASSWTPQHLQEGLPGSSCIIGEG